jgi:hypothetical protein
MHADDRSDLPALRGNPGVAQLAGASSLAHPLGRRLGLPIDIGDMDVAAEADHVIEAKFVKEGKQLLVAEAAIGQNRDTAPRRHQFRQPPQADVLIIVALVLEFFFPDSQP